MEPLNEDEQNILKGLIRSDLRKRARGLPAMFAKWGDNTDLSALHSRVELLCGIYRKLGGDPERIDNLDLKALMPDEQR